MRLVFWMFTALCVALSAGAGTTYEFASRTTGLQASTLAGVVSIDGSNARIDLREGDGMLFKSGSIILSRDRGHALAVFDPSTKSFYELSLDQLASMTSALGGGMVHLRFEQPRVSSRDLGDGGRIEGFPTRRTSLDATVNILIDALGQKMTSRMRMQTESWTTDRLSGDLMNVFQAGAMRTGIPALDTLIEAQTISMKGRFPLRQTTTLHLLQNGRDLITTTNTSVTNIRTVSISPALFVSPVGYAKVPNPIERALKAAP